MPVEHGYELLDGYPKESGSGSQARAVLAWRGPAQNRYAFLREIFGNSTLPPFVNVRRSFPGNPQLKPMEYEMEPYEGASPHKWGGGPLMSLDDLPTSECDWLIKVSYGFDIRDAPSSSEQQRPDIPDGTFLEIKRKVDLEAVEIPGRLLGWGNLAGWALPGADPTIDDDLVDVAYVDVFTLDMNWSNVPRPPLAHAFTMAGCANSETWLGIPPSGIVFMGAEHQWRLNFAGVITCDLHYTFVGKTVNDPEWPYAGKVNNRIGVWGKRWCPIPAPGTTKSHWRPVVNIDGVAVLPYATAAAFNALFVQVP